MTIGVEDAKTQLAGGTALLSGELVPPPGLHIIPLAADAARIDQPSIVLRFGMALLGGRPAPAQRLGRVLRHLEAVRKEELSIAFGGCLVAFDSRSVHFSKVHDRLTG